MWFKRLVGFEEINANQVRENILLEGEYLTSKINGKKYRHGRLSIPTLYELRNRLADLEEYNDEIAISELVGNVRTLHIENENATFQAASQFNLLEMASPHVSPESGVDIYENDYTQGPACAITCGAGTVYRNYFVKLKDQIGQSRSNQVDCLNDIGEYFDNNNSHLWKMENGYAFATREGLKNISEHIEKLSVIEYEELKSKLRVGIHFNTEVTVHEQNHLVTQVYCSALPIRYSSIETNEWEAFARLILEGTYESTFYAALQNYKETGNKNLFLTLVGGGVFGNPIDWILESIEKSVIKFRNTPLEVKIVSYGGSKEKVRNFLNSLNDKSH